MKKQRHLDFGVELVARVALLVLGSALAMAGLIRPGLGGLAVSALGIATITLAAILPRIERIRLFGTHGLDARLRQEVASRKRTQKWASTPESGRVGGEAE